MKKSNDPIKLKEIKDNELNREYIKIVGGIKKVSLDQFITLQNGSLMTYLVLIMKQI